MKITVGMGTIDEYIPYVQAGADEVFIGYVPSYFKEFGILPALNRREAMYCDVQIGSRSELRSLSKMVEDYKVPIAITLNSLYYHPDQFPLIKRMILECIEDGFNTFIIGDLSLLVYLKNENILNKICVHLSGEFGEINSYGIDFIKQFGIKRIIFHRKVSLDNMANMIEKSMEHEAFVLNEKCHFHGGYCQSLHCDDLKHICHLPYKMEKPCIDVSIEEQVPASGGCGICSMFRLEKMGIQYGKLVSRGNFMEDTIEDIYLMKRALSIVYKSKNEEQYIKNVRKELFDNECSKNCYYRLHSVLKKS